MVGWKGMVGGKGVEGKPTKRLGQFFDRCVGDAALADGMAQHLHQMPNEGCFNRMDQLQGVGHNMQLPNKTGECHAIAISCS